MDATWMQLMAAAPRHADAIVVASIVLSAGTYLFDFGSNIVVLVEYSTRFMRLSQREKEGILSCTGECRHQASDVTGYFYCLLANFVLCHSLNALLFKLKFTHREAPLFAAYFLPLIHLYRLSHLLWRTLSCKGIQDIRSPEMNGLYCILGSAMEGVPMLIVQFNGYLVLTRDGVFSHSMSTTFKVSVAASLLSAAYNGGTSVQSIAKNATTLKQKLGAGAMGAGFTLSATVVRCLTFTYIVIHMHEYFSQQRTQREEAKFHVYDAIILLVIAGSTVVYTLYFWLMHSPRQFSKRLRDPRHLLTALAFGYMSTFLGPLYPLISQASDADQLGSYIFRLKLLALSLLHLSLDLAVLCVTNKLVTLPMLYLIVSSLTLVGYMVFLIAYIKFDKSCGPTTCTSSNESIIPAAHGDDDVNDHKLILFSKPCMATNAQPQDMQEKPQVDVVSQHVNPSSQSTHLTRSEKTADMACTIGGPFPSKNYVSAHPPLVLSHDVELPEDKGCRPLITSILSLDREIKFTNKRDRSSIAAWSSFDSSPIAYYSGYPLN